MVDPNPDPRGFFTAEAGAGASRIVVSPRRRWPEGRLPPALQPTEDGLIKRAFFLCVFAVEMALGAT